MPKPALHKKPGPPTSGHVHAISPARMSFWRRHWLFRYGLVVVLAILAGYAALQIAVRVAPFDDTRLRKLDVSTVIRDRNGSVLRAYLAPNDQWCFPATIAKTASAMIQATIATEDKRFYQHHGIDWRAVARACYKNLLAGRIVSGASTISMQVAGFAIDSRERTFARKFRQAFLALQIEHHWTKQDILESYLTHASYGGNICGVEAAALRYFDRTAADLTPGQAALLAGLPQSPERYRPDRHMKRALKRRQYVLAQMQESGVISSADVRRIASLAVAVDIHEVPVRAPHFCDVVRAGYPGSTMIRTTLDPTIQSRAEKLLAGAVAERRGAGVNNGAIVVLKNSTCEVLALVGSADYWNKYTDGQVNGALGFRSPGSALKPLIYARALDTDALAPDETLFDVPVTYAGYSPQNYDRQFRGPVSASKALAWSLNIPAMDLLQRLGVAEFRDYLEMNRIPLKFSRYGDPGLSMAIGTCSIRLLDLTRAYASLASGGDLKNPRWLKDGKKQQPGQPWITPAAANVVLAALADENLRAPEDLDPQLDGLTGVAWKTGTSNGFRDAWTIAVARDYTVGVWMGNMDGRASRALVGSKAAAPVALELARDLKIGQSARWPDMSSGVTIADACAVTGLAPGEFCKHLKPARFLNGHEHENICKLHTMVEVDQSSGQCLCTRCSAGHHLDNVVCAEFAPEVASWLRTNSHPWADVIKPDHNPECLLAGYGAPPSIITPARGAEIILLEELPADQQKIALSARTANPSERLYWFINGSLAGVATAFDGVNILPDPGRHQVVCTDEQGRSSETWFTVESSGKVEKAAKWSRLSDSN